MKRIAHSKAMGAALMGASLIAIGSVGFSAWVISGGAVTEQNNTLGISAATVSDNRVAFENVAGTEKKVVWANVSPSDGQKETSYQSDKTLIDASTTTSSTTTYGTGQAYLVFGPNTEASTNQIQAEYSGSSLVTKIGEVEHLSITFSYRLKIKSTENGGINHLMNTGNEHGALDKIELSFKATDISSDSSEQTTQNAALEALDDAEGSDWIVNPFDADTGNAVTIFANKADNSATPAVACVGSDALTTLAIGATANDTAITNITGVASKAYILTTASPNGIGDDVTFTTTMMWRWGSAFAYGNPVTMDLTDGTSLDSAISALTSLKTTLENKTLNMVIKATGHIN